MKESGVGLTLDAPPQTVDDPTAEIKRLHFEVFAIWAICDQVLFEYPF